MRAGVRVCGRVCLYICVSVHGVRVFVGIDERKDECIAPMLSVCVAV